MERKGEREIRHKGWRGEIHYALQRLKEAGEFADDMHVHFVPIVYRPRRELLLMA